MKCGNSTLPMSPVATEIEFAWVGHAPPMRSPQSTPEITPRARTLTFLARPSTIESPQYIRERPELIDPLTQVVSLLQPDLSYSKFVEGAGAWRVPRAEQGRPFFCAMLQGAIRLEVQGAEPILVEQGDFVLIPAAYDFTSSSIVTRSPRDFTCIPTETQPNVFRLGDLSAEPDVRMLIGYCAFGSTDAALLVSLLPTLIHARDEGRLTTFIQFAVQEFHSTRPARSAVLARLMELLFIEALRSGGPHSPNGILRGLTDDRMAVAIRRIHESPTEPWTVGKLARPAPCRVPLSSIGFATPLACRRWNISCTGG